MLADVRASWAQEVAQESKKLTGGAKYRSNPAPVVGNSVTMSHGSLLFSLPSLIPACEIRLGSHGWIHLKASNYSSARAGPSGSSFPPTVRVAASERFLLKGF